MFAGISSFKICIDMFIRYVISTIVVSDAAGVASHPVRHQSKPEARRLKNRRWRMRSLKMAGYSIECMM